MGVRVKNYTTNIGAQAGTSPEYLDTSFTQRETTVDGQTFHWGPNQRRNFLDQGVGAAHAAFSTSDGGGVEEDAIPFNNSRF